MARDHGPFTPEEDEPSGRSGAPAELDEFDSRMLDLDEEQESPFLRAQKRVPVRRGPLPRKTANRLKYLVLAVGSLALVGAIGVTLYRYGAHSWRFRLESSDDIEIAGIENVSRAQVMDVLGGDIGRNVFFVPLAERKQQLETIPWVESATVMRLLPNRLKVEIRERTPIAFVQIGSRIALIDSAGMVMDTPAGGAKKYSFPVIVGMADQEPISTRAARMKLYTAIVRELDSEGAHYSQDVSEVDLTDPEDVKVSVADSAGEVLVHLGSAKFLERFKLYVANIQRWRQQYAGLSSVDLRYDGQVIVNPEAARAAPPAEAAASETTTPVPDKKQPVRPKPSRRKRRH